MTDRPDGLTRVHELPHRYIPALVRPVRPARTTFLQGPGRLKLGEPFDFRITSRPDIGVVQIRQSFQFDGATIPFPAWWVTYTPFHPVVQTPAMVHDYFCRLRPHWFSSVEAAQLLHDMLIIGKAHPRKARWIHKAVLMGGPKWGERAW